MTINYSVNNPLNQKKEREQEQKAKNIDLDTKKLMSLIFGPGLGLELEQINIYNEIKNQTIIDSFRYKHKLYEGSLEFLKLELKIISLKNEYNLDPLIHLKFVTDNLQYICLINENKKYYYEIFCKDFFKHEETIREVSYFYDYDYEYDKKNYSLHNFNCNIS